MASLAESSVASVPISNLELLQHHLLNHIKPSPIARPQRQSERPQEAARHTVDRSYLAVPDAFMSGHVTDDILESTDDYRTPTRPLNPSAPRSSASQATAGGGMAAMVQPSPSQEAFAALTKGTTFHGFPGGDTQPMDTQVYRDYTESMAKPRETTPKKTVIHLQISPNGESTYNTVVTDRTPKTLAEGDTGFIDFAGEYQSPSPMAQSTHSTSDLDDLLASPQTQLRHDEFATTAMPETPALAGHKRRSSGEIVTSVATAAKTPGFSELFGLSKGRILSASQLFNQTQAPSSPLPTAPRSDPVATRPSPDLNHHFSVSSPTVVGSSPILMMHGRPSSAIGDPRGTYTSMGESQERRLTRLRKELELDHRIGKNALLEEGEYGDDDENSEERRLERMRLQHVMSDQAFSEWTKVSAPSRPGSRPTSSRKLRATIDLVTPATARKGDHVEFDLLDDEHESEDDTLPKAEGHQADDNDVYDELGQTVLRSQRDGLEDEVAVNMTNDNEADIEHAERPVDDAELEDTQIPELGVEQPAEKKLDDLVVATQRSAIVDSQPKQDTKRSLLARNSSQPSSISISYVPGSQYIGATSQELAQRANTEYRLLEHVGSKIPSSPPLVYVEDPIPDNSAEASLLRQQVLAQFKKPTAPPDVESRVQQEIPESDLPDHEPVLQQAVDLSGPRAAAESNSVPQLYSTARSHLSGSGPSPSKHATVPLSTSQSQQTSWTSPSPRKAAGVRRFGEIAADSSPPRASGEASFDVGAIMSDVMTADDQQFINAISSPQREKPPKRRKLMQVKSLSPLPKISILRQSSTTAADRQKEEQSSPQKGTPSATANANARPEKAVKVLQNSPSKANELPASTPDDPPAISTNTPESVRRRESEGANAMSQLLSARAVKPAKTAQSRASKMRHAETAYAYGKPKVRTKPSRLKLKKPEKEHDEATDGPPLVRAREDAAATVDHNAAAEEQENAPIVMAPNRIFALFKGSYNAYYPATWLSTSADGKSYRVKFDDDTVTLIEPHQVSTLELRIDDQVKIDIPEMRSKVWIIKGFGPVADAGVVGPVGSDVHGHITLKVQAKASRSSVPTSGPVTQGDRELVTAHVSRIKLTHTMWPRFEIRAFTPPNASAPGISRDVTPSTGVQTPLGAETPSSRTRRSIVAGGKTLGRQTSRLREESSVSFSRSSGAAGLFNGMAFAISYGSNEGEKAEVTRLIRSHGGMILNEGLEELFNVPDLDEPATPSKRSSKASAAPRENTGLQLKPEYSHLGYVALIADRHSRRAKYMQALALGLPTLSGRWVTDSLTTTKNETLNQVDAIPVDWRRYLLPAGESSYLGGAIRSRTLPAVHNSSKLIDLLRDRELLINGGGVLIVSTKKSKGTWERRKAYAFLTLAIGADVVKRVADMKEAKALLHGEPDLWRWVYVDGSIAEAAEALLGKQVDAGKKRKRRDDGDRVEAGTMYAGDGRVRIVSDEFVVQSLIMGALVD